MHSPVSKARTRRRSRIKLSKSLQEQLLDAVARKSAEQPQVDVDLNRAAAPVQSTKRQLDTPSEIDPLPTKRARLTSADTRQPSVENDKVDPVPQATLQQPKPQPPKRPYASFLQDFLDPVRPGCPESVHTFVSEWLESIGSDRKKRCRSDSHLHHSDDSVPRQLTRSASEMGCTQGADGIAVPPPPSDKPRSSAPDADTESAAPSGDTGSSRSTSKSLIEDPAYRLANLNRNNIFMRPSYEELPDHIAKLVNDVRKGRDSPEPSLEQVRQDSKLDALSWAGAGEPQVERYFSTHIFPDPDIGESLQRTDRQPMAKRIVPQSESKLKLSNPVPDMLYGYNSTEALTTGQQDLFSSVGDTMMANSQGMVYPFLVVEFKGDGPSGAGSLWAATNQCIGGSVCCINVAESLNRQLKQYKSDKGSFNSAAFSIAMSGTEARLFISWKHNELKYYMARVEAFLLQRPDNYLEFRRYVRNIFDWGKNKRLEEIRDSLDTILEERRKKASEVAKSRPPPSNSSATSGGKRRKSSSREDSSGSDTST
ncbi:hypothetical protein GGR51DRAFT_527478 [Nemania sp. FL0031]|nr:hypothetical protein GGR51DRAFT_527478 [Nemania sp. FL0031]